ICWHIVDDKDLFILTEPSPWAATPLQLLKEHSAEIIQRILSNGGRYLSLLISSHGLSLIAAGLPLAVAAILLRNDFGFRLLGMTALLHGLVLTAYWVVFQQRYLL